MIDYLIMLGALGFRLLVWTVTRRSGRRGGYR